MTGAGLCETCLGQLTADDLGAMCTNCWNEREALLQERHDEWWKESDDD